MESNNTSEIKEYVANISYFDTLVTLHDHYEAIIDRTNIATMNDSVWYFVLKEEIKKRS